MGAGYDSHPGRLCKGLYSLHTRTSRITLQYVSQLPSPAGRPPGCQPPPNPHNRQK